MPYYQQPEFVADAVASVVHEVDFLLVSEDGDGPAPWGEEDEDGGDVEYENIASIVSEKNHGTASAINAGVDALPGYGPQGYDWLTWVSSDNIYRPGWVKALLDATDEDTGAVYGGFTWAKGKSERYLFVPHTPDRLINQEDCYYGPVFLIRREVWKEAGPHRGRISHDYDHWLRVEEACWKMGKKIVGVDKDLCWYRAHDKRATVLRRDQYDAKHWQAEGKKRREALGVKELLP